LLIDVYKLIHLLEDRPSEETSVDQLKEQIGGNCWTDNNDERLSPQDLINKVGESRDFYAVAEKHPELTEHLRRLSAVDFTYPILMHEGHIIDGMHRVAKAFIENKQTINVIKIDKIPAEALMDQEAESIPTISEVWEVLEELIDGREHTEVRKLEDGEGLYLWDVTVAEEDGYVEYSYMREGVYPEGQETNNTVRITFFDTDDIPVGGYSVALNTLTDKP